jgi:WD domain, G-beta repeat/S1 RNA binding domain
MLAWGSSDGTVKVWDVLTKVVQILRDHTSWIQDVAFSPDGKQIASASLDGTVKIWKVPPLQESTGTRTGVKVGDEIEVKVLRVDESKRRVGLSRKQVSRSEDEGGEAAAEASARGGHQRGRELRGGTGSGAGPLFSLAGNAEGEEGESGVADDRQ